MESESQLFWKNQVNKNAEGLDPVDRINEIMYGLIMALTFTCTISVTHGGTKPVSVILWSVFGCNLAWGIVDGCITIFSSLMYRGARLRALRKIRSGEEDEAFDAIRDNLHPVLAEIFSNQDFSHIREELIKLPEPPKRIPLTVKDLRAGAEAFILVLIATLPVVTPFYFIHEPFMASRVSNGVALVLLTIAGFIFGKKTGFNPWLMSLVLVLLGSCLVLLAIYLGG